jgi:hypothetical protein
MSGQLAYPRVVTDQGDAVSRNLGEVGQHCFGGSVIELTSVDDAWGRCPGRQHEVERLASPNRVGAEHLGWHEILLGNPPAHPGRVAPTAFVQGALMVRAGCIAPIRLGMPDEQKDQGHVGWKAFMWYSDCSAERRPAPTGQTRRTRQP